MTILLLAGKLSITNAPMYIVMDGYDVLGSLNDVPRGIKTSCAFPSTEDIVNHYSSHTYLETAKLPTLSTPGANLPPHLKIAAACPGIYGWKTMEMFCVHLRNSRTEDNIIATYSRKPMMMMIGT